MELKLFLVLCLGVTFANDLLDVEEEEFVNAVSLGDLWKYFIINLGDADNCYYTVQIEYNSGIESFHKKITEGLDAIKNHLWGKPEFKSHAEKAFQALYDISSNMIRYKKLIENALEEKKARNIVHTILEFSATVGKHYGNYLFHKSKISKENHHALKFFNEYDQKIHDKTFEHFKEQTKIVKKCLQKIRNPCLYKN